MLLTPGPTDIRPEIAKAHAEGFGVSHRHGEFVHTLSEVKDKLVDLFMQDNLSHNYHCAVFSGSGTSAMEACISSLVLPFKKTAVIIGGAYGSRAAAIMDTHHIPYDVVRVASSYDLVGYVDTSYEQVYVVNIETSTGEYFDLHTVHQSFPNAMMFVDATSAFGCVDYSPYLDYIGAISFSSNKCLQSTPGLGMAIWRSDLETLDRCHYLALSQYNKAIMPFTAATHTLSALKTALAFCRNNGKLFRQRMVRTIQELSNLGIPCTNINPSPVVASFEHPTVPYREMREHLDAAGFFIYGPTCDGAGFRISTISYLYDKYFNKLLKALTQVSA